MRVRMGLLPSWEPTCRLVTIASWCPLQGKVVVFWTSCKAQYQGYNHVCALGPAYGSGSPCAGRLHSSHYLISIVRIQDSKLDEVYRQIFLQGWYLHWDSICAPGPAFGPGSPHAGKSHLLQSYFSMTCKATVGFLTCEAGAHIRTICVHLGLAFWWGSAPLHHIPLVLSGFATKVMLLACRS